MGSKPHKFERNKQRVIDYLKGLDRPIRATRLRLALSSANRHGQIMPLHTGMLAQIAEATPEIVITRGGYYSWGILREHCPRPSAWWSYADGWHPIPEMDYVPGKSV